jgi:hypothetical protein
MMSRQRRTSSHVPEERVQTGQAHWRQGTFIQSTTFLPLETATLSWVSDMSEQAIAEYLKKAEDCRLEAARASRAEERASWLLMAEEWLRLSRGVEHDDRQDEHKRTRVDGNTHPVHSQIVSR